MYLFFPDLLFSANYFCLVEKERKYEGTKIMNEGKKEREEDPQKKMVPCLT